VRKGYAKIAQLEPHRFRIVSGEGDRNAVAARVWAEVEPALPRIQRMTQ
jgi:thymidylate kinase